MVSNFTFWPRLTVVGWNPTDAETARAVDDAVATMVARYAVR
jgi:hypothetical protein